MQSDGATRLRLSPQTPQYQAVPATAVALNSNDGAGSPRRSSARSATPSSTKRRGNGGDHTQAASTSARSAKNCCFCCLQVRNSDAYVGQDTVLEMTDEKPTLDEVKLWGTSFDRLMRNTTGQKMFADFLKSEFSDENILFWQACEELKKEKNPEKIEEKARIIYEDFISILSPKEVSLDSRVREIINNNMVHPTSHTFDEAQGQIYTLMHRDSYPRFISSSCYKTLLQSMDQPQSADL